MRQHGDDIGVFLAVCRAGSFVAASEPLRLSASAIAKAIARLESRLGIRLFLRTTRTLAVTPEGIIYRDVCLEARRDIELTEARLSSLAGEPAGRLRISLPPLLGAHVVAPALYRLCRQWPSLDLEISATPLPLDLINDGIDLAVRIGEPPIVTGLVARHVGIQRVTLCGSARYFRTRSVPKDIEGLFQHDLVAQSSGASPHPWLLRQSSGEIITLRPKARLMLDGSLLVSSAIRDGQGIGILPRWLVRDEIAAGDLIAVLDDQIAGHLPINVIWPASPVMLPRLRVAIDTVVECIRAQLRDGTLS